MLLLYVAFAGKFSTLKLFFKNPLEIGCAGVHNWIGIWSIIIYVRHHYVHCPDAATLFSANPIVIAIIMMIWGKEKLSVKRIVGILIWVYWRRSYCHPVPISEFVSIAIFLR